MPSLALVGLVAAALLGARLLLLPHLDRTLVPRATLARIDRTTRLMPWLITAALLLSCLGFLAQWA
jgi:hypothetical protein